MNTKVTGSSETQYPFCLCLLGQEGSRDKEVVSPSRDKRKGHIIATVTDDYVVIEILA